MSAPDDGSQASGVGLGVIYRQDPKSATREFRGEAAIIPPNDARVSILDGIATQIWAMCDGPGRSLDSIVDTLETEYDAPRETILEDTQDLLAQLIDLGALLTSENLR